ncbi:hypothetical protein K0M31_018446 [Melipona bicolor]|uniref:Uncharacterized protein n=1 Tax=Melipona bicolor TaxID=60889 RepID=A0AA40G3G6_9HYME|nr:hypothetical protein K0M31_018446 [Melipona bicolor]
MARFPAPASGPFNEVASLVDLDLACVTSDIVGDDSMCLDKELIQPRTMALAGEAAATSLPLPLLCLLPVSSLCTPCGIRLSFQVSNQSSVVIGLIRFDSNMYCCETNMTGVWFSDLKNSILKTIVDAEDTKEYGYWD